MTDPFVSIYEIVFQLTMRMVGSAEIANDVPRLRKTLRLFETIEQSATPTSIIFPWMPTIALIRRTIAGGRLYYLFTGIMNDRKKSGRREDDALQYLIDMGDEIKHVIQVRHQIALDLCLNHLQTDPMFLLVHPWCCLRWAAKYRYQCLLHAYLHWQQSVLV